MMGRKGFTLVELIGCLALMGIVLCIGLVATRETLATALSTLTDVSESQIYNAAELYILENKTTWTNDGEEYTCLMVKSLVDAGYFEEGEVTTYKNKFVRIVREPKTRVINNIKLVDECK